MQKTLPAKLGEALDEAIIPGDFGSSITVQRLENFKPVGPPITIQINPASIIEDADLRKAEQGY